ncbi:unnamed protein product [Trichogramma brassicae]|uniref:Uncharacterized protein n=1 Tax=Trichogramma brassicae TaxID=86971 RepID=A0A6H5ISC3_9HYME|nr:unnamed protein product [Trichogramma brassicae]
MSLWQHFDGNEDFESCVPTFKKKSRPATREDPDPDQPDVESNIGNDTHPYAEAEPVPKFLTDFEGWKSYVIDNWRYRHDRFLVDPDDSLRSQQTYLLDALWASDRATMSSIVDEFIAMRKRCRAERLPRIIEDPSLKFKKLPRLQLKDICPYTKITDELAEKLEEIYVQEKVILCNLGLANVLEKECFEQYVSQALPEIRYTLSMPAGETYCFFDFDSVKEAQDFYSRGHGKLKFVINERKVPFCLGYVKSGSVERSIQLASRCRIKSNRNADAIPHIHCNERQEFPFDELRAACYNVSKRLSKRRRRRISGNRECGAIDRATIFIIHICGVRIDWHRYQLGITDVRFASNKYGYYCNVAIGSWNSIIIRNRVERKFFFLNCHRCSRSSVIKLIVCVCIRYNLSTMKKTYTCAFATFSCERSARRVSRKTAAHRTMELRFLRWALLFLLLTILTAEAARTTTTKVSTK